MPIQLSGSLVITGSITTTGVITMSGSIASASYSSTSDLLQGTGSVGFATTASLLAVSSSQQQISASLLNVVAVYATTGSNSFRADQSITGSLVVSSTITAQTLVVQTVTSSIVYSSGSNNFGNQLSNNQTFTGSVNITGSLAIAGNITGNAITATGLLYANAAESNTLYTGAFLWTPGSYNFFNQKTDHSLVIGTYNANSPVAALTITQAGTSIFSNTVCASILTAATVSAGSPTNSRIVANSNTLYGYYDVEVNPRWTLGRDVWTGGSGGLAFGVGGTTTCYSMIGDPSGYGCTIGFAILVPNGCSGTTYEKMRLTGTGLGIGTTTPATKLSIRSDAADDGILLEKSDGTDIARLFYDGTSTNARLDMFCGGSTKVQIHTNGTSHFSGGNVGIATDAPSTKFEVCSGYIKNTGATNASGYLYYNTSANYTLSLSGNASYAQLYSTDNIALMFGNNNTARMFIQTNGFVGVATTSPKAVFDVACGNAHSTISTWCKNAEHNIMYNGFDIVMNEASFAGELYVQANGGGIGIQAVFDVLANYDRICVIQRNSIRRGSEILIIPSYFSQSGSKRICIQQCNGSGADMSMSAMLIGTSYGGTYICAQA